MRTSSPVEAGDVGEHGVEDCAGRRSLLAIVIVSTPVAVTVMSTNIKNLISGPVMRPFIVATSAPGTGPTSKVPQPGISDAAIRTA